MPKYEIWMEDAQHPEWAEAACLLGEAEGDTFRDAVANWFAAQPFQSRVYDERGPSYWGRRLHPTREEAATLFPSPK